MISIESYFKDSNRRVSSITSVGASRNLFEKTDIAYQIVWYGDISRREMTERVIKDLQESLDAETGTHI